MKKLILLSLSLLVFSSCGNDDKSGSQNVVNRPLPVPEDQLNFTRSGSVREVLTDKKIGTWKADAANRVLKLDIDRRTVDGILAINSTTDRKVYPDDRFRFNYMSTGGEKSLGDRFVSSIYLVIPADYSGEMSKIGLDSAVLTTLDLFNKHDELITQYFAYLFI